MTLMHEGVVRPIPIGMIFDEVCIVLRVERAELVSKSRHRRIVLAKELVVDLARKLTNMSYPEIAYEFRRTNHSTFKTAHDRFRKKSEMGIPERLEQDDPILKNLPDETIGDLSARLYVSLRDRADRDALRGKA